MDARSCPRKVDERYNLVELDIHYKKEIKLGESIITSIDNGIIEDNKIEFIHSIKEKSESEVNAFGRTLWIKR